MVGAGFKSPAELTLDVYVFWTIMDFSYACDMLHVVYVCNYEFCVLSRCSC
jgi:hypothetical protein